MMEDHQQNEDRVFFKKKSGLVNGDRLSSLSVVLIALSLFILLVLNYD